MHQRLGALVTLLLGLTLVTVGCLEALPATPLAGDTSGAGIDEGAAAEASAGSAGPAEFVALSILVRLSDRSNLLLPIEDVELTPEPAGPSAFVTNLSRLSIGETRSLGALAVEEDSHVPAQELTVTVFDGLGLSELVVAIEPWVATEDRRLTLTVTALAAGEVTLTSLTADVPATARTQEASPLYGTLVWPDGKRAPVDGIDRVVEVPSDHPRYKTSQQVTYAIEDAPDGVVWHLDGEEIATGPKLTWKTERGQHLLEASLPGSDEQLALRLFVDEELTYHGSVQVGTGPVQEDVAGVNGKSYKLLLGEGATKVLSMLRPVSSVGDMQDLDLYLIDPEGTTVAQSAREGHSLEEMLATGDLPAGEYTLWVHGATGMEMEHTLTVSVRY